MTLFKQKKGWLVVGTTKLFAKDLKKQGLTE